MIPVIIGVSLIAFLAIHFVPGDPVQIMMHGRASPETLAAAHARLGLISRSWSNTGTSSPTQQWEISAHQLSRMPMFQKLLANG